MKAIEPLSLLAPDGKVMVDESSDIAIVHGAKPRLTRDYLICRVLELSKYQNLKDMMTAKRIYDYVLKAEENYQLLLEDVDYEFVKKKVESFTPFLENGFRFLPFLERISNPTEIPLTQFQEQK